MHPDSSDPHYLHRKIGLSVAVRPPIQSPARIAWAHDGSLVVATGEGKLLSTHPAMGTRELVALPCPVSGLGVADGRVVVFRADGRWQELDLRGAEVYGGAHPFVDDVQIQFHERRVLVTGPTARDRQTLFFENGEKVFRVRLPPRAVAFIDPNGRVGLAQATRDGLEVVRMQPGSRFSSAPVLPHALEVFGEHVVGVTGRGASVWPLGTAHTHAIRLDGTTCAALDPTGRWLGLGTWSGGVALVDLTQPGSIARPEFVQASDAPIRAIDFSPSGSWLATAGDDLIMWTWEA